MAGLGGVGAHEGALLIALQHGDVEVAVEENHGDAGGLGGVRNVLGGVGRGVLHHVHHQQVVAVGDGGVDLVQLLALVGLGVEVLVLNAQLLQLLVHRGADGGDVGVGKVVVEHADLQVGSLRGGGRGAGALGLGSASRGGAGAAAAGQQANRHSGRENQSKFLLHFHSSCCGTDLYETFPS